MSWAGKFCHFAKRECPGTDDPERGGCQMWWKAVEENVQSGEVRVVEDCGFCYQKRLLDETAKAGRSYAAAVESTRNEVVRGMTGIALGAAREAAVGVVKEWKGLMGPQVEHLTWQPLNGTKEDRRHGS